VEALASMNHEKTRIRLKEWAVNVGDKEALKIIEMNEKKRLLYPKKQNSKRSSCVHQ